MSKTLLVSDKKNPLNINTRTFKERERELQVIEVSEKELFEAEKKSPYSRWAQYNLEHSKDIMWLQMKHPKAAAILTFLIDQMDTTNAVMCSYQVLQEMFDISPDTVRRAVKILREKGFIWVYKSGSSNVYTINDSLCWKAWGKNRRYSKFPANIIISMSEQEKAEQAKYEHLKKDRLNHIATKEINEEYQYGGKGENQNGD